MANKIIYLRYLPLTQKIENDFYLLNLYKAGYEIEYWDLTKIYFNRNLDVELYTPQTGIKVLSVETYKELEACLRTNGRALFIILMSFEWRLRRLFLLLNTYDCTTLSFGESPIPFYLAHRNIANILRVINMKKIVNKMRNIYMQYLVRSGRIKFYNYSLVAGQNGWRGVGNVTYSCFSNTKIYSFNSTDYNKYLNDNSHTVIKENQYIVFIDEYYPFHPDAVLFNLKTIDPIVYFRQLNHAFDIIEQKYNMPVIIAAHPKALKYKDFNYFNNRKIEFGKTCALIKNSCFVIAHDSTAVDFAIMCKKPLLFLTSDEIKLTMVSNYNAIKLCATLFNSPLLSMNKIESTSLPDKMRLNASQKIFFENFMKDYHTILDLGKTNDELIIEYVNEIFGKTIR